jgi:hypothetical protein
MEEDMKSFLSSLPTFQTILIWIGGIPTIITGICIGIMIFFTARNKAFSLNDFKHIKHLNNRLNNQEEILRNKIINAPRGVKFMYRWYIGELNYHDLIQRR